MDHFIYIRAVQLKSINNVYKTIDLKVTLDFLVPSYGHNIQILILRPLHYSYYARCRAVFNISILWMACSEYCRSRRLYNIIYI